MKTLELEQDAMGGLAASGGSVANVHFTSNTVEWATPQAFFDAQNEIHDFELDVCAMDR